MAGIMFGTDDRVILNSGPHTYTDSNGRSFKSVSRLLNDIEIPFDSEGISMIMAKGSKIKQVEILAEWKAKADSSIEKGNFIHDNLEQYHKFGTCDEKLKDVITQIKPLYSNYYRVYSEVMLSDHEFCVAGQTDFVVQRQKIKSSLYDFYDYKTNQAKGIVFDSINRKQDPWKHYNKFFLDPLSHLEDCNYNRYSLQISLYAYIAQKQYGINIGRLAIIFIDNDFKVQIYPVAYLQNEAELLLSYSSRELKKLPGSDIVSNNKQNIEDNEDW